MSAAPVSAVLLATHTVPIPITAALLLVLVVGACIPKFRQSGWYAALCLLAGVAIARTELGAALVDLTRAAIGAGT